MARPLPLLSAALAAAILSLPCGGTPGQAVLSAEPPKNGRKEPPPLRSGRQQIEKALEESTSAEFIETPIQDVVDYLRQLKKVNIVIDRRALADAGVGTPSAITANLRNVPLRSALDLLLRDLDLTWTIRSEVLLITTPEEAQSMLVTKVYEVGDLVTCRDEKGQLWEDYDALLDTITSTVASHTWDAVGGPGTIIGATFGAAKVLTVSQTYHVHQQIAGLLEQLRAVARKNPGHGKPPLRKRPPQVSGMGVPVVGMGGAGGMGRGSW